MIDFVIIAAAILGYPVPETLMRPVTEFHELTSPGASWYYETDDIRALIIRGAHLPKLREGGHFPPDWVCREYYTLCSAHSIWLGKQLEMNLDRPEPWRQWIRENELLLRFWTNARDAQQPYYSVLSRREYIAEVKKLFDPEDWAIGNWPLPVPLWRFTEW